MSETEEEQFFDRFATLIHQIAAETGMSVKEILSSLTALAPKGTSDQKLISLYRQMADLTLPECRHTCRAPLSCCSPEYCAAAEERAKSWGVSLEPTGHERLPFMGEEGCIVPPHLRPSCTIHTCQINSCGFKPGDKDWTDKYFQLRQEIMELEYERETSLESAQKEKPMSRCYELTIVVNDYEDSNYEAIVDAIKGLGYDGDADVIGREIIVNSEVVNLCSGRTEEEASSEIHRAIWKANGGFCAVHVGLRCLDNDIPYFSGTKEDYREFVEEGDTS